MTIKKGNNGRHYLGRKMNKFDTQFTENMPNNFYDTEIWDELTIDMENIEILNCRTILFRNLIRYKLNQYYCENI